MEPTEAPAVDATLPHGSPLELFERRYRILAPLGEGGFGRVELVEDTHHDDALLALKRLHPRMLRTEEAVVRFRTEIQALRALRHPGIPQIHNDGRTNAGETYYTMEYVSGRTLEEELRLCPRWPCARAAALFGALVEILEYAHSQRIVHRDLKPANIISSESSPGATRVVILDFGIAKLLADVESSTAGPDSLTRMGLGTPAYMSPEQRLGARVDFRTDVFALGALMHQVVTGEPHRREDEQRSEACVRRQRSCGVDGRLARLVASALSERPEDRPTTARLRERLSELQEPRTLWRPRRVAVMVALAAFAVSATLGWRLRANDADKVGLSPRSVHSAEDAHERDRRPLESTTTQGTVFTPVENAPHIREMSPPPTRGSSAAIAASSGQFAVAPVRASSPTPTASPVRFEPNALPPSLLIGADSSRDDFGWPSTLVHDATGIVLVRIPAGRHAIGATTYDSDRKPHERTFEYVEATRLSYVGACEVTWDQYELFCEATGRAAPPQPRWKPDSSHPVVNISWDDASAFCAWSGLKLPDEFQWEFAARAGTTTRYPWGDARGPEPGALHENLCDLSAIAYQPTLRGRHFAFDDGHAATAPVGSFRANALGVHDAIGNVSEWCRDQELDGNERVVHVVRGGAWSTPRADSRFSSRSLLPATSKQGYLGFRVAWTP